MPMCPRVPASRYPEGTLDPGGTPKGQIGWTVCAIITGRERKALRCYNMQGAGREALRCYNSCRQGGRHCAVVTDRSEGAWRDALL